MTEIELTYVDNNETFPHTGDEADNRHMKCKCIVKGDLGHECGCEFT